MFKLLYLIRIRSAKKDISLGYMYLYIIFLTSIFNIYTNLLIESPIFKKNSFKNRLSILSKNI